MVLKTKDDKPSHQGLRRTKLLWITEQDDLSAYGSFCQSYEAVYQCDQSGPQGLPSLSEYDVVLVNASVLHDVGLLGRLRGTALVIYSEQLDEHLDRVAISQGACDYLVLDELDVVNMERRIRYALERQYQGSQLAKLAHYDGLTQIPNRMLFRDRLEHGLQLAKRKKKRLALLYMDLNGFKQINDLFGHDAGDQIICASAQRLSETVRSSDTVARVGGDEFLVLLENIDSSAHVARVAQKLIDAICMPIRVGERQLQVGCSLGIALFPQAGKTSDTLQKHADLAMYQAKQRPGSSYQFYNRELQQETRAQLKLEAELQRAVAQDEFTLHYQPRIDSLTGQVEGFEALLRWQHPERGLLEPAAFMDIAEAAGLMLELNYWVLEQACTGLKRLERVAGRSLTLSINMSVMQFTDERLTQRLAEVLKSSNVEGQQLYLEISESSCMANLEQMRLVMVGMKPLGVRFVLDNFGTDRSSFLYLQQLPLSAVKIDRCFVGSMDGNAEHLALIQAMVSLLKRLDKQVMAEGVESALQEQQLLQAGCFLVQGYRFGRPAKLALAERCIKTSDIRMLPA